MTDELDQVVRGLEAERHKPSVWWRTTTAEQRKHLQELDDATADLEPARNPYSGRYIAREILKEYE